MPQPLGVSDYPCFIGIRMGTADINSHGLRYHGDLSMHVGAANLFVAGGDGNVNVSSDGDLLTLHAQNIRLSGNVLIDHLASISIRNPAAVGQLVAMDIDGRLGWVPSSESQLKMTTWDGTDVVVVQPVERTNSIEIRSGDPEAHSGLFLPASGRLMGRSDGYSSSWRELRVPIAFSKPGPWIVESGPEGLALAFDGNDITAIRWDGGTADLNLRSCGAGRVLADGSEVGYRDRAQTEVTGEHEITTGDRGRHLLCDSPGCQILLRQHASLNMPIGAEVVVITGESTSATLTAEHHVRLVGRGISGWEIAIDPCSRLTLLKIRGDAWHAALS